MRAWWQAEGLVPNRIMVWQFDPPKRLAAPPPIPHSVDFWAAKWCRKCNRI